VKTNLLKFCFIFLAHYGVSNFSYAQAPGKPQPKKIEIQLNWKAEPEFGGFYAAHIEGAFAKNDLVGKIVEGGAGTPTIQMLAAQKVDFAVVSGDELIIARSKGANVIALFATFQTAPYGFLLHDSSPIKTFEDLYKSTSTVAVIKGLPMITFLDRKFGPHKLKYVPNPGGLANFADDREFVQQCFISSEPVQATKKGLKTRTLRVSETGYNPYTAVLAVHGEVMRKRPELVKAVVDSIREGWNLYLKDSTKTNQRLIELNRSFDLETLAAIQKIETPLIQTAETEKNGIGTMTAERWTQLIEQLNQLKLLKKPVVATDVFVNL
jgi:NitT/TauT family transport system substrate-binding protein